MTLQKILIIIGALTLLFLTILVLFSFTVFMYCVYRQIREDIKKRKTRHIAEE